MDTERPLSTLLHYSHVRSQSMKLNRSNGHAETTRAGRHAPCSVMCRHSG